MPAAATACPCGTGLPLDACCGPLLAGAAAPTAERLMRSRYTAYALGDLAHVRRTWHPSTRPGRLVEQDVRWTGLEVIATSAGGLLAAEGTVEFRASYDDGRGGGQVHEVSRFVRDAGRWAYLDGAVSPR